MDSIDNKKSLRQLFTLKWEHNVDLPRKKRLNERRDTTKILLR